MLPPQWCLGPTATRGHSLKLKGPRDANLVSNPERTTCAGGEGRAASAIDNLEDGSCRDGRAVSGDRVAIGLSANDLGTEELTYSTAQDGGGTGACPAGSDSCEAR